MEDGELMEFRDLVDGGVLRVPEGTGAFHSRAFADMFTAWDAHCWAQRKVWKYSRLVPADFMAVRERWAI